MRKLAFGLALVVMLSACGGSSGGAAGDPVAAVNNVITAMKAKQFSSIAPMICSAKRDEIAASLDPAAALASAAPGVAAQTILDAMAIDFSDVSVTQTSVSGDNAVVAVKGQMKITVDPAKMKEVVKAILLAQGLPADDATINMAMQSLTSEMASTKPIDSQVNVVKENGVWLVCDNLS
jgi:hypothetical protein